MTKVTNFNFTFSLNILTTMY